MYNVLFGTQRLVLNNIILRDMLRVYYQHKHVFTD